MVEKEIGQNGADDAPLRSPLLRINEGTIGKLYRSFKPSFYGEEHPWCIDVHSHRPHKQFPINAVEKALDVQVYDPVIPPAPLSCCAEGVLG
jgi:hypothetical protein